METWYWQLVVVENGRVVSLPMRDGNQVAVLNDAVALSVVSLPMRDGNPKQALVVGAPCARCEPTYEGWKLSLREGRAVPPIVVSLPMRDGNRFVSLPMY